MFHQRLPRGSEFLAKAFGIPIGIKGDLDMQDYRPNALNQPPRFKQAMQTGIAFFIFPLKMF
jgi:hypothetical protein